MNGATKIHKKLNLSSLAKYFLGIFLLLVILAGLTITILYQAKIKSEIASRKAREITYEEPLTELIGSNFKSVVSDLMILSESPALQKVFDNDMPDSLEKVSQLFLSFSEKKRIYDQIRFIDEKGMEIVRINFNNGIPNIVPEEQLQNKAQRYYFKDTVKLQQGEVFISPLDLNMEQGKIEQPLKPMIRFGTPVFDSNGQKSGVILINYLATNLIKILDQIYSHPFSYSMLLNSEGYWFKGRTPDEEWGFMYEDRKHRTFANIFPEAWQEISKADSGQFHSANGVFTFVTVYPLLEGWGSSTGSGKAFKPSKTSVKYDEYYWKIVLYVTPGLLSKMSKNILYELLLWYAGVIGLLVIISLLWGYTITIRKMASEEIKTKNIQLEGLSAKLAKYLSPQVYDSIFSGKKEVRVETDRKKLTVFFSDIKDFTELTDNMEAEELSSLLNDYLNEMSKIALRYGGTIDKFMGDSIMMFFGDPETKGTKDDALACILMAIEMREFIKSLRWKWEEEGISRPLRIRMGINTGFCTVGNFGSEDRLDYTIIGGQVNLTNRLEAIAETDQILISHETYALVKDIVLCEKKEKIKVKGIAYPIQTYQVVDLHENLTRKENKLKEEMNGLSVQIDFNMMEKNRAIESLKSVISKIERDDK